jgi:trehalose/maltose transport system substrate-binding protein
MLRSRGFAAFALLAIALSGCRQKPRDPVTLSYFRLGWSQPDESPTAEPLSQRFIRETGIQLKNLPVPENTSDQLDLSRRLLESGSGPDVLGVDLIWSGVLGDDLANLGPSLKEEVSSLEPKLLPSYTVDGRLVAIPNTVQIGVLEYRTDLLREYGYDHPPKTWDELERMALRIQAGERAKGRKDFWGYVWQGADAEALTCNALEWQFSEGGGRIIEEDHTISVNNAAAIRSWQRAKRWIGRISPPGVLAYRELDSINVFDSGGAAFNRVWGAAGIARNGLWRQLHWRSTLAEEKTGYTSIPGGSRRSVGTLGGSGLAVSQRSGHPQEAIQLVKFLIRAEIQSESNAGSDTPNTLEVYNQSSASEQEEAGGPTHKPGVVTRPSSETGRAYERVSQAYIRAVHAVLSGQKGAPEAAAELEKELVQITGFRTGPPKTE